MDLSSRRPLREISSSNHERDNRDRGRLGRSHSAHINQAGIELLQGIVVAAKSFHHAWSIPFNQHVITLGEVLQYGLPGRIFEIECQALLVTVGETRRQLLCIFRPRRSSGACEFVRRWGFDFRTSAPISANIIVQNAPGPTRVSSRTLIPSSAPAMAPSSFYRFIAAVFINYSAIWRLVASTKRAKWGNGQKGKRGE